MKLHWFHRSLDLWYWVGYIPPHVGGCQKYGPFLGTLNIRCRIIIGIQKGTIILKAPHVGDFISLLLTTDEPPRRPLGFRV